MGCRMGLVLAALQFSHLEGIDCVVGPPGDELISLPNNKNERLALHSMIRDCSVYNK